MAIQKLSDQHEYVSRLNVRLGGILAVLLATVVALSVVSSLAVRLISAALLLAALIEIARASRVSYWNDAPDPHEFQKYAGDEPDFMKEVALPYVIKAFDYNQPRLIAKGRLLNWSISFLTAAITVLAIARIAGA